MNKHIIVADDHSMIRKGVKLLLMSRLHCKNVSEAESCSGLMQELKKGICTHIILDVVLVDGTSLEIIPTIKKLYPAIKIMIFSMQPADIYYEAFRLYDIRYYVNKSASEEETIDCINHFLNNVWHPIPTDEKASTNPFSLLAPRELEVLHYLLNGHSTNNIAETLNLSNSTVSTFKKRIFDKTGTSNLAQLYELSSIHNLAFYLKSNAPKPH